MLVLTRKLNESIQIGDEIVVTVLSVHGDQVKLGIQAPKHIDIYRKEVYVSIQQANKQAAEQTMEHVNALMNFAQNAKKEKKE